MGTAKNPGQAERFLDPGGSVLHDIAGGGPITARTFLDPAGFFRKKPDNTAAMAAQAEAERRARIAESTGRINQIYDSPERQAQYTDFIGALREHYTDDANRQKETADRNTKFSIARSGLTGGSAEVDAKRNLGEEFTRGILSAENRAQSGLSGLRAQDESARMGLIQLAQGGADAATVGARAAANLRAGTQGQLADATSRGLGDIFANTTSTYRAQQDAAARRAGQTAPIGSVYGRP